MSTGDFSVRAAAVGRIRAAMNEDASVRAPARTQLTAAEWHAVHKLDAGITAAPNRHHRRWLDAEARKAAKAARRKR